MIVIVKSVDVFLLNINIFLAVNILVIINVSVIVNVLFQINIIFIIINVQSVYGVYIVLPTYWHSSFVSHTVAYEMKTILFSPPPPPPPSQFSKDLYVASLMRFRSSDVIGTKLID